jgi:GTP:adenosylcobinamide-phosphate guanylyltransferase
MDCVITAGGVPDPDDSLYRYTQGKAKAELEIGGRKMLEWVVAALEEATQVDNIVVVGLGDDRGMTLARPVHHLPNQGSLIANVIAGIQWLREEKGVTGAILLSSSDIPGLKGHMVDEFVEMCRPFNCSIYYNFVTKQVLEARYPHSNRTYVKLKGLEIAGGDLLLVQSDLAYSHHDLWEALVNGRKHAWKLARIVGLRMLLKLLTRRVTLADIEQAAERILGNPSKIMLNPYAELAMDVDKAGQFELLQADLANK